MIGEIPGRPRLDVCFVSSDQEAHDDIVGLGDFKERIDVWEIRRHPWGGREIADLKTLVHSLGLRKVLHRVAEQIQVRRRTFVSVIGMQIGFVSDYHSYNLVFSWG